MNVETKLKKNIDNISEIYKTLINVIKRIGWS